jgi:CRP-like cAMP-binding protein
VAARPSSALGNPKDNHLLAALSEASFEALRPDLEAVPLPLGMVVYESGGAQRYVYFPTTSIVSLLYVLANGSSAEIAVTGNEGLVGISLFMGGETTPSRAVVQSAGWGYRLRGEVLRREFESGGVLQHLLLRYTQALITQMTQTAVCNRHHTVDQQLCRWLLLSLDRLPGNELVMTQELIANMLGVRREGVTEAAGKLQDEGLIRYTRGHIRVLDRQQLEARVCECYGVVKKEYDRLLPEIKPH